MLTKLIGLCLRWPLLVLVVSAMLLLLGGRAMLSTPVDAIPDLSDVQVIVKVNYPGQSPDIVEQQITYPLSSLLMSVPGSQTVRGFSFYGDAYLYVIFADDTDLYWARSRVMEYLAQAQSQLPQGAEVTIGPDASGVGWIFQYVLRDTSGRHHLADLTRLQDWFIRQELQSVAGVSEVAKVGGMVQTYQVVLDPLKLLHYGIPLNQVRQAVLAANEQTGGSVVEMGETEFMLRSHGYIQSLDDLALVPLNISNQRGTPLLLKDIATLRLGPQTRRGVAEWNGQGEVVGGIVIMRDGENALKVVEAVKDKIASLQQALPEGVEIVTAYDRSGLVQRAIATLKHKLIQEILVVVLVCGLFLWHVRATLVVAVCLPASLLLGFYLMQWFGISANLMSLAGIAIAIGALVDAAIVMVENVHRRFEQASEHLLQSAQQRWRIVGRACAEVGPALFGSLMIITLSFLPVFALEGQEGRLFTPLALTKTFVMAAAALLSVTLIPVLIALCLRSKPKQEDANPLNRWLKALYQPFLRLALSAPRLVVVVCLAIAASAWYPWNKLGSEFMPPLEEGDLLYMPTTLPGVSIQEAGQILQQTDRLIRTVAEVDTVMGKVGRADTATDPAPLTMIETTIALKPKSQWRDGITLDDIVAELEAKVQLPGLTNAWVQPIRTRIDMLTTGVKTPVGIKILASDLDAVDIATSEIEKQLQQIPGTRSVIGERPLSGRYIDIQPDRFAAAQYGLSIADIQDAVKMAIGGQTISESVQGKQRFPIQLRYPRDYRSDLQQIRSLPLISRNGNWLTLEQVAQVRIVDGPSLIKSENARYIGWVFIDLEHGVGVGDYVKQLQGQLADNITLPEQTTFAIAGQYEYMQRVQSKLSWIVPLTLLIIFVLLYLTFSSVWQALLVLATLPIALSGSLWLLFYLDYSLSVAVAVGILALAGVVAEFGVVMLLYLNTSWQQKALTPQQRIQQGALQRVRPKAMTVLTIVLSLMPIMLGSGTGSEVMQRIAAPMLGGMLVAPLISMLLIPAVYWLVKRGNSAKPQSTDV